MNAYKHIYLNLSKVYFILTHLFQSALSFSQVKTYIYIYIFEGSPSEEVTDIKK